GRADGGGATLSGGKKGDQAARRAVFSSRRRPLFSAVRWRRRLELREVRDPLLVGTGPEIATRAPQRSVGDRERSGALVRFGVWVDLSSSTGRPGDDTCRLRYLRRTASVIVALPRISSEAPDRPPATRPPKLTGGGACLRPRWLCLSPRRGRCRARRCRTPHPARHRSQRR